MQRSLLSSDEDCNFATLLNKERLNLLYKGLPAAITGNCILAVILVFTQDHDISDQIQYSWLAAMFLVLVWRIYIYFNFRRNPTSIEPVNPLVIFRASAICTGVIWAFAPILLFPENDIVFQATLSFILAGVSAGAAASLALDKISALGFIAPPLLSLAIAFLISDGNETSIMALMTLLFFGFISFNCVQSERQFRENIRLRVIAIQSENALFTSAARLRSLFDLSPFGIVLSDYISGDILELNDRLVSLSGYTKSEFTQLNQWEITPKSYNQQELKQYECLAQTGRYGPYEKELIQKDGTLLPVILNGVLIQEPNGRQLIWSIVEDISDKKRVDKMKSEFVSTVSHELRTPLTAITGAIGLLANHFINEWPEPMQKMLHIANINSQRLSNLINDLLDMEKITSDRMHFNLQRHQILSLVEQAIEINKPYAISYGIDLSLAENSINADVITDASRLQQVLANLLSNAIKFSPGGGCVRLQVLRTKNNSIRVAITDYGPGIPSGFRHRIFQRFSQADSSDTRAKGGTGLGLAITKELMQKMGGSVGFDSEEGKGSTFWVELPTS